MSRLAALAAYFLRETLTNLRLHRLAAALSVLIVGAGAFIFEAFALGSYNLSQIVARGGGAPFVELYFRSGVAHERQRQLLDRVAGLPQVEVARWTSEQQALESFRREGYGQLLEGLEDNPLPASIFVQMRPQVSLEQARELARELGSAAEVEQWSDSGELAERLATFATAVRALVGVVGIFLALLLGFLIAGTVRLALEARRAEIAILESVGATSTFIRLPFVLEGTLLGAAGGLLSVGALYVLYRALVRGLDIGHALLLGFGSLSFFEPAMTVGCTLATTLLGATAGLLATRRD